MEQDKYLQEEDLIEQAEGMIGEMTKKYDINEAYLMTPAQKKDVLKKSTQAIQGAYTVNNMLMKVQTPKMKKLVKEFMNIAKEIEKEAKNMTKEV